MGTMRTLTTASLGAMAMYWLDPCSGAQRRSVIARRLEHLRGDGADAPDGAADDRGWITSDGPAAHRHQEDVDPTMGVYPVQPGADRLP